MQNSLMEAESNPHFYYVHKLKSNKKAGSAKCVAFQACIIS